MSAPVVWLKLRSSSFPGPFIGAAFTVALVPKTPIFRLTATRLYLPLLLRLRRSDDDVRVVVPRFWSSLDNVCALAAAVEGAFCCPHGPSGGPVGKLVEAIAVRVEVVHSAADAVHRPGALNLEECLRGQKNEKNRECVAE